MSGDFLPPGAEEENLFGTACVSRGRLFYDDCVVFLKIVLPS